jgi:hypothetical protein
MRKMEFHGLVGTDSLPVPRRISQQKQNVAEKRAAVLNFPRGCQAVGVLWREREASGSQRGAGKAVLSPSGTQDFLLLF